MIAGVVLLAAAAFVLSYAGIHQIALRAGVSPQLARLYPVIFDAMLVIAGAAALALRGAGWWARFYAWASLLILLVAVAAGDAFHATHVVLPIQPTRAVAAVIPWAFLLVAFGLLLEMLRHFRRTRTSNGQPGHAAAVSAAAGAGAAANGTGSAGVGNGDPGSPAQRAAVTWAAAGTAAAGGALPQPRTGLDLLLGPREGTPPAMPAARPDDSTAAEEHPGQAGHYDTGHHPDQVAYGEETGYVHPDSYRDHGDYPGPGDGADHEGHAEPGDSGQEDNPGPDHAGTVAAPPAATGTAAATGDAAPGAPDPTAAATDGAAATGDAAPGVPDTAPAAPGLTAAATDGAAATGDAGAADGKEAPGQAKNDETSEPQPVAANSAEAKAQTSPAEAKDSPAPDGHATQPPARAVMPLLERLRSTPAPPGD